MFLVEREDGKTFALKILNKHSCRDSRKTKRFLREIAFCEQFNSPSLVKVVDRGFKQDGNLKQPFYVMPLYECSLRKLMVVPDVDYSSVLGMLLTLLSSLKSFYDAGHVHRDIKPENILFNKDSMCLVLADFGVAHINDYLPDLTLQTTNVERLANFKYAAPEQRVADGMIDHRTDQYAFGLIINELFTNAIPQGSGYAEILSVSENYSYLDPVVERMISQNLNDRYESISVLLADIEAQKRIKRVEDDTKMFNLQVVDSSEISIIDKEWIDPNLVFKLNMAPDRDWIQVFNSYTGTTWFSTDGFYLDPKRFTVSGDKILVPNTQGNKNHLADTCREMPGFVSWTNEMMNKRIEKDNREAFEALVRARENEVRQREINADINGFLNSL